MYDSVYFCQDIFDRVSLWWPGRSQGRRTLAFILTLDTVPATFTIRLRTNRRTFFSEIRSILENPSSIS
jgi:hypothetical protein